MQDACESVELQRQQDEYFLDQSRLSKLKSEQEQLEAEERERRKVTVPRCNVCINQFLFIKLLSCNHTL